MMMRILALLLALTVGASAQMGQSPGWPPLVPTAASPGRPTFTYQTSTAGQGSVSGANVNYASTSTGTGSATNFVVGMTYVWNAFSETLTGVTLNGNTLTANAAGSGYILIGSDTTSKLDIIVIYGVASISTSTVVITYTTGAGGPLAAGVMYFWSAVTTDFSTLKPTTVFAPTTSDPSVTATGSVLNGGAVLAHVAGFGGSASSFGFTTPNSVGILSADDTFGTTEAGHANNISPAQPSGTVTANWSGSNSGGGAVDLSLAIWR